MRALSIDLRNYGFNIRKYDTGKVVINQKAPPMDPEAPIFNGHRGELHEVLFKYAKSLGIPINLGCRIEEYFEDDEKAGVILDSGEKVLFPLLCD